jgi:hypothetical protein
MNFWPLPARAVLFIDNNLFLRFRKIVEILLCSTVDRRYNYPMKFLNLVSRRSLLIPLFYSLFLFAPVFLTALINTTYASEVCFSYNSGWYTQSPNSVVHYGTTPLTVPNHTPANILQEIPFKAGCENHDGYFFAYSPSYIGGITDAESPSGLMLLKYGDMRILTGQQAVSWNLDPAANPNATDLTSNMKEHENDLINYIAEHKNITVRATGFYSGKGSYPEVAYPSKAVDVPMTNCVHVAGSGPRKIVLQRGTSWDNSRAVNMLFEADNLINNGFKKIDPFKTFFDKFSFYIDLEKVPEDMAYKNRGDGKLIFDIFGTYNKLRSTSSCGNDAAAYIFFYKRPGFYFAYASIDHPVVFYNGAESQEDPEQRALTLIHELGHGYAGLLDEYSSPDMANSQELASKLQLGVIPNCSTNPSRDYRNQENNLIYGSVSTEGCKYFSSPDITHPTAYYRPSVNSIMNNLNISPKFNVISCGFITSVILENDYRRSNAQKYWPLCANLDTDKSGLLSLKSAPSTSNISQVTEKTNTYDISGSGFTTTDNSVKLTFAGSATLTSSIGKMLTAVFPSITKKSFLASVFNSLALNPPTSATYQAVGLASDGAILRFTVPSTVPPGKYSISVGAQNSPWKETGYSINVISPTPIDQDPNVPSGQDSGSLVSTHSLIITKSGSGTVSGSSIDCGTICTASLPAGTEVTINATPTYGYKFIGWSDTCANATCTFTLTAPKTLTATFEKIDYSRVVLRTQTPTIIGVSSTLSNTEPVPVAQGATLNLSLANHEFSLSTFPYHRRINAEILIQNSSGVSIHVHSGRWANNVLEFAIPDDLIPGDYMVSVASTNEVLNNKDSSISYITNWGVQSNTIKISVRQRLASKDPSKIKIKSDLGTVQLTWKDNGENESEYEVSLYKLEDATKTSTLIKTLILPANSTSTAERNVVSEGRYYFTVRGKLLDGSYTETIQSNVVKVDTPKTPKITVSAMSSTSLMIMWPESDPDLNYVIRSTVKRSNGVTYGLPAVNATGTKKILTNLEQTSEYCYWIRAYYYPTNMSPLLAPTKGVCTKLLSATASSAVRAETSAAKIESGSSYNTGSSETTSVTTKTVTDSNVQPTTAVTEPLTATQTTTETSSQTTNANLTTDPNTTVTTTSTKPSLKLISLSSIEIWPKGSMHTITWTVTGISNVNLKLMKNGNFDRYIMRDTATTGTNMSYTWTVPSDLQSGVRYSIKLVNNAGTYSDISIGTFTIE